MIIRAISSGSEADDDDTDTLDDHDAVAARDRYERSSSVFPSSPTPPPASGGALTTTTAVRLAWIGATVAVVVLLLVDLAAALTPLSVQLPTSFSLATALLWTPRDQWLSATTVNSVVGQLFVIVWIHQREAALASQRRRHLSTRRPHQLPVWLLRSLPWAPIAGVVLVGHLASCLYVLLALFESHGSRQSFWLGRARAARTVPRV
ncbi:hypothetical protein PINS_up004630 [Pythium insidiosum]|nr:hypothetical protein PINS_up004630 [Pythium insidiosum]